MKEMREGEWRDLPGLEEFFEVHIDGPVASKEREITIQRTNTLGKPTTTYTRIKKWRTLKPKPTYHGYYHIALSVNGKVKNRRQHILVAEAFLEKPKGKDLVNHKNGNKLDNRAKNLEWIDSKGNVRHGFKMGLCKSSGINYEIQIKVLYKGEITVYEDYYTAMDALGISANNLASLLNKNHPSQSYKGYEVRYADDSTPWKSSVVGNRILDTKTGKTYNSIRECNRDTGIWRKRIQRDERFKDIDKNGMEIDIPNKNKRHKFYNLTITSKPNQDRQIDTYWHGDVKTYKNYKTLMEEVGIPLSNLATVLHGRNKTYRGLQIKYSDDLAQWEEKVIDKSPIMDTKTGKIYDTLKQCGEGTGMNKDTIHNWTKIDKRFKRIDIRKIKEKK